MSSSLLGQTLRDNIIAGVPTRTKAYSDYTGLPVPPCGDFAPRSTSINAPPWMPTLTSPHRLSLHNEIEHFVAYMKPTDKELLLRTDLINRFTKLIETLDPQVSVQAVGSTVSGLHFPTSDIDMVVTLAGARAGYYSTSTLSARTTLTLLEYKIRSSGFARKIESILNASVPLLRITDAVTGIDIDLTAADEHGVKATNMVQSYMKSENATVIKSLVMVLKLFLATRKLGTTFTGGINSYLLVWMMVAWVKLEMPKLVGGAHSERPSNNVDDLISRMGTLNVSSSSGPSRRSDPQVDLGVALKAFFRFYGKDFDTTTTTIRFTSTSVAYGVKSYTYSRYTQQRYLLSITDPADVTIDPGFKGIRDQACAGELSGSLSHPRCARKWNSGQGGIGKGQGTGNLGLRPWGRLCGPRREEEENGGQVAQKSKIVGP
ncbi:PAP associated domain containing 5 [Coprinopsis cinerea okayama7|uniref:polynucleotide adenylyltransferase n=1 Tax=Coprinopsis cinerea (strain Okayama-7 / 130 / ATCC MYA-4618 / FGSC 9003) TaxID=240176 RepID=A8P226_COPC7|nr:PAP associated domain containing 5 [Coprinopsis cinerea okayama7\|eukprot:XP_001838228.2 PAP associated domain containing 5 [Coprinopsis cinerea okayama7\